MKIELLVQSNDRRDLAVTHKDRVVKWPSNTWKKLQHFDTEDLYQELNNYWSTKTKKWQDELFSKYLACQEIMLDELTVEELSEKLSNTTVELLDMHNYDEVYKYVTENEYINTNYDKLPDDIIDYSAVNLLESQTYCKPDYIRLAVLATIFKSMAPVWGMYTAAVSNNRRTDTVGAKHKEVMALKLVSKSHLFETEAYLKLERYAVTWARKSQNNSKAAITHGISVDDIPFFFLSSAIVKRMMIQRFGEKADNLISALWSVFDQANSDLSKGVTEKPFTIGQSDDAGSEKKTLADRNNMSQLVPNHYYIIYETYIQHKTDSFYKEVYDQNVPNKDIDYNLYLETIQSYQNKIREIPSFNRQNYHSVIMGKVFTNLINIDELDHLKQDIWVNYCIPVAGACLKLKGYPELALLLTSPTMKLRKDNNETVLSSVKFNEFTTLNRANLKKYYDSAPIKLGESVKNTFIKDVLNLLVSQVFDFNESIFVDLKNILADFLVNYNSTCKQGTIDDDLLPPEWADAVPYYS